MSVTDYLDPLNYGASTGGAAGSAETTATLGEDPVDVREPPDQTRTSHLQIARMKNALIALTQDSKGGTRQRVRYQSASPFGATEMGIWASGSLGAPMWSNGTSSVQLLSQVWPTTSVTSASYTVLATDQIVEVNRAGSVTLTLPVVPAAGQTLFVLDVSGAALTNNITINRDGADTINGATSIVIAANYGWVCLTGQVGAWYIMGSKLGTSWTAPGFSNSYVNFGAPYANVGYYKDDGGIVRVRGAVKSGTNATTIFTLPAGFRPSDTVSFTAPVDGASDILSVSAAGAVSCATGGNTSAILSCIQFPAEA